MANIIKKREGELPAFSTGMDPLHLVRDFFRWDPFRQMVPGLFGAAEERTFLPSFEVKETKDGYLFKADLPGVKEEDIDISLTGNRLTVSGKRESEEGESGETYYTYERSYGSFSRSFTLPEGIDADHVKADLKEGVLSLLLPKKPELQPKKVSLKGGGGKEKIKA
jgi:HSP20 family protein